MELSDYRILTEAEEKALEEEASRVIQAYIKPYHSFFVLY
jgi:hypothetical protein